MHPEGFAGRVLCVFTFSFCKHVGCVCFASNKAERGGGAGIIRWPPAGQSEERGWRRCSGGFFSDAASLFPHASAGFQRASHPSASSHTEVQRVRSWVQRPCGDSANIDWGRRTRAARHGAALCCQRQAKRNKLWSARECKCCLYGLYIWRASLFRKHVYPSVSQCRLYRTASVNTDKHINIQGIWLSDPWFYKFKDLSTYQLAFFF